MNYTYGYIMAEYHNTTPFQFGHGETKNLVSHSKKMLKENLRIFNPPSHVSLSSLLFNMQWH
ncbi:putative E3 ubiquitin-protein ligase rbrA [Gossypium arboreum]|uniref:Putative E3 ubiquitin-protein ligase rbrA n=1 Tax=Gossypium arboreum TaxID=29729 RepID=A0A0B0MUF2_GOSAR|nr:putative E3 ubiquitin-protein ligase rbrA [Gossypium arboreum]KHG07411.1 putative E3 ubiquitin-protein ligase rbrA [Gossypium arboreum]